MSDSQVSFICCGSTPVMGRLDLLTTTCNFPRKICTLCTLFTKVNNMYPQYHELTAPLIWPEESHLLSVSTVRYKNKCLCCHIAFFHPSTAKESGFLPVLRERRFFLLGLSFPLNLSFLTMFFLLRNMKCVWYLFQQAWLWY